jgi:hypothetical protein
MNWLQLALTLEQQIPGLIAAAKAIRENHGQPAKPIQEYHDEAAAISRRSNRPPQRSRNNAHHHC